MKTSFFYRALIRILQLVVPLTLLSVVLFCVHIHQNPLDLTPFQGRFEQSLSQLAPGFKVTLSKPILTSDGWGHPLVIMSENITITAPDTQHPSVTIPRMQLVFKTAHLLVGRLQPSEITVFEPKIDVRRKALSDPLDLAEDAEDAWLLALGTQLMGPNPPLSRLKIEGGQIAIDDPEGFGRWDFPKVDAVLAHTSSQFTWDLKTTLAGAAVDLRGQYHMHKGETTASLTCQDLDLGVLRQIKPGAVRAAPPFVRDAVARMQAIQGILSGSFEGTYAPEVGLRHGHAKGQFRDVSVPLLDFFDEAFQVTKADVDASFDGREGVIKTLTLTSRGGTLSLKGGGQWDERTQAATYHVMGEGRTIAVNQLRHLWPRGLGEDARVWVLKNIQVGQVPRATLDFRGKSVGGTHTIEALGGNIDIQNASVRYLEGMPIVRNVSGLATYTPDEFLIKIKGGVSDGITVTGGQVDLVDLQAVESRLKAVLSLKGRVPDALTLMDHKPLELAKDFGLQPNQAQGDAVIDLNLACPLREDISLKDVEVSAKADMKNVVLTNPVSTLPCVVSDGVYRLDVSSKGMTLSGRGNVNGSPSTMKWTQAFDQQGRVALDLNASITPLFLKNAGRDVTQYFRGQAPATLTYRSSGPSSGAAALVIDLGPAHLNFLGWEKLEQTPGTLKAKLLFEKGNLIAIEGLNAKAEKGGTMEGAALLDASGLKSLQISRLYLGENNLVANATRRSDGGYDVRLSGASLNLERAWDDFAKPSKEPLAIPLSVRLTVEKLRFGPDRYLYQNDMNFLYQNKRIQSLHYRAGISRKYPNLFVDMHIQEASPGVRIFRLHTDEGGKFLKSLGIYENVRGGRLQMYAKRNDMDPRGYWEGKVRMIKFYLRQAPVFGQLLSLAFPTGLMDLVSEQGMPFELFKANLRFNDRKVVFAKGRANGSSLGLTVAGTLDRADQMLALHGSIIPAYFLNTLISKVPLVGALLSGGKHEGLVSFTYKITGSQSNPQISVNPASLLTPGFIRKIFEPATDMSLETDEEDDFEVEPAPMPPSHPSVKKGAR